MKKTTLLAVALCAAALFTPVTRAQNLYVGSNSSGVTTNFTSGTNAYVNTYIGFDPGANSNTLNVLNTNTLLTNTGFFLYVGNEGSGNSLVISNGGKVANENGYIGEGPGSSNNSVLVTGTDSLWTNRAGLNIGRSGSSNSLVISNGGKVANVNSSYVGTYSSDNTVLVTGTDSFWTNSTDLYVGLDGSGNSLVISNGGRVANSSATIGANSTSSNNSVLVTGAGSLWTNSGEFAVGLRGAGNTLTVADGGTLAASNVIIASVAASSGTLNIGRFGTNDTAGTIISPTIAFGDGTGAINFNQRDAVTITSAISGNGTVSQLGAGTTTLSASNTYTGATTVAAGKLVVNGSISGSAVTVQSGASLSGSGVVGAISGAGSIDPGNSPGIFTATSLDPSGGLSFNFEFTSLNPTYSSATASGNDVLRLTDAAPFVASLDAGNTVNIYFNVGLLEVGLIYTGGFYTDAGADFLAAIESALFTYYVKDAAGSVTYEGETYAELGPDFDITLTTVSQSADFGGGTVNGRVAQFEVVPEPSTYALLALAGAGAAFLRWRKRAKVA